MGCEHGLLLLEPGKRGLCVTEAELEFSQSRYRPDLAQAKAEPTRQVEPGVSVQAALLRAAQPRLEQRQAGQRPGQLGVLAGLTGECDCFVKAR
jgi:hypothetical protein